MATEKAKGAEGAKGKSGDEAATKTPLKSGMLRVYDNSLKKESEVTKFVYDQLRVEEFNGAKRYKVVEGKPNPIPEAEKK